MMAKTAGSSASLYRNAGRATALAVVVAGAVVLLIVWLVASDFGDESESDERVSEAYIPAESSDQSIPDIASLLKSAAEDRNKNPQDEEPQVAALMSRYQLSKQGARFVAASKFDTIETGKNAYRIRVRFPKGGSADLSIKLAIKESYAPPAESNSSAGTAPRSRLRVVEFSKRKVRGEFDFTLRYVIPSGEVPNDLLQSLRTSVPKTARERVVRALVPVSDVLAQQSSGASGVDVVFEGASKGFAEEMAGAMEQGIGQGLDIPGMEDGAVSAAFEAAGNILDAMDARTGHLRRRNQLRLLHACAGAPTNELTRKMYEEDPGSRDKILEELDALDGELSANTAVRFASILADVAAGLAGLPALGVAAGGASGWVNDTLDKLSDELIEMAAKQVTPCGCETGRWYGSVSYSSRLNESSTTVSPNQKGLVHKVKRSIDRDVTYVLSGEVTEIQPVGPPGSSKSKLRATVTQRQNALRQGESDLTWEVVCGKQGPVDKLHQRTVEVVDEVGQGDGAAGHIVVVLHYDGAYSIGGGAPYMQIRRTVTNSREGSSSAERCVPTPPTSSHVDVTTTSNDGIVVSVEGRATPPNLRSLKGSRRSTSHVFGDEVTTWDLTCRVN